MWELRGDVDGPYPVGPVDVLVAEDDLAVAREVVTEQAVDADALGRSGRRARRAAPARALWSCWRSSCWRPRLLGRLLTLTWR